MGKVSIGKTVDYKTLETALVKAAEEMGWKARVKDEFRRDFRLGSVEEVQNYNHTMVHLRGRVFSAMKVFVYDKDPSDHFYVWTGFPYGFASDRRVKTYLSTASKYL